MPIPQRRKNPISAPRPVPGVGVLGAGIVGSQVIHVLQSSREDFAARSGTEMEVRHVLVRNVDAPHSAPIDRELLTTSSAEAIDSMDLVVELIGGIKPTRTPVLYALNQDIPVVTSSKVLLAARGPELYKAVAPNGTDLYYEATVVGAAPVVYGLRESLAGDRIITVMGIVDGTTNFILGAISTKGLSYKNTLKQAQGLGFTEADPTADVEGFDAAAKCSILTSPAFRTRVGIDDVAVEGVSSITKEDMEEVARVDHTIKLLIIAERRINEDGCEGVAMRVYPAQVPSDHPLASVDGALNVILAEGEAAGRLMLCDQGVGGVPTASAVLSDLIAAAHHHAFDGHAPRESIYTHLPILDPGSTHTHYQIRLKVEDRLDVLSDAAGIFTRRSVSIQSVYQRNDEVPGACVIVMTSHHTRETDLRAVARTLSVSDTVYEMTSTVRVKGE